WDRRWFEVRFVMLERDVRVEDLPVQRVRELSGNAVQVLRPRTGEFVDSAQVRPRVGEDGSDYPGHVRRGNRRGLAQSEWQFDPASVAHCRTGEGEKVLQEHRRPDGDNR